MGEKSFAPAGFIPTWANAFSSSTAVGSENRTHGPLNNPSSIPTINTTGNSQSLRNMPECHHVTESSSVNSSTSLTRAISSKSSAKLASSSRSCSNCIMALLSSSKFSTRLSASGVFSDFNFKGTPFGPTPSGKLQTDSLPLTAPASAEPFGNLKQAVNAPCETNHLCRHLNSRKHGDLFSKRTF